MSKRSSSVSPSSKEKVSKDDSSSSTTSSINNFNAKLEELSIKFTIMSAEVGKQISTISENTKNRFPEMDNETDRKMTIQRQQTQNDVAKLISQIRVMNEQALITQKANFDQILQQINSSIDQSKNSHKYH